MDFDSAACKIARSDPLENYGNAIEHQSAL